MLTFTMKPRYSVCNTTLYTGDFTTLATTGELNSFTAMWHFDPDWGDPKLSSEWQTL